MKTMLMAGALGVCLWGAGARAEVGTEPSSVKQTETKTTYQETRPADPSLAPATTTTTTTDQTAVSTEVGERNARYTQMDKPKNSNADENGNVMRGVTFLVGGGVEGYTGDLAPTVRPGVTWGVSAAIKPTKVLGLELGYSGAANNISASYAPSEVGVSGPDIVRNGASALATIGLSASAVQPYILGGIGYNHYTVRAGQDVGFKDANNGDIPLGAGLRTHLGNFTADLRGDYHFAFNQDFAPGVRESRFLGINKPGAGIYQAMLQVGSTF